MYLRDFNHASRKVQGSVHPSDRRKRRVRKSAEDIYTNEAVEEPHTGYFEQLHPSGNHCMASKTDGTLHRYKPRTDDVRDISHNHLLWVVGA